MRGQTDPAAINDAIGTDCRKSRGKLNRLTCKAGSKPDLRNFLPGVSISLRNSISQGTCSAIVCVKNNKIIGSDTGLTINGHLVCSIAQHGKNLIDIICAPFVAGQINGLIFCKVSQVERGGGEVVTSNRRNRGAAINGQRADAGCVAQRQRRTRADM